MKAIHALVILMIWAGGSALAGPDPADVLPPADIKNAKLGLWEESIQTTRPPQADVDMSHVDMSGLSPEQKARIDAVLKRQHAEHAAQGGGPVTTTKTKKFCVKAGDIQRSFSMTKDAHDGAQCKASEVSRTSSRIALSVVCTAKEGQITTDITFDVKSQTQTSAEMHMKGTMMGRAYDNTERADAHWVGPDCGTVKSSSRD